MSRDIRALSTLVLKGKGATEESRRIFFGDTDRDRLNKFVASSPLVHFKQLYEWGEILEYEGTQSIRLGVERGGEVCGSIAVYVKRIPGLSLTYLSASRGPILDLKDREVLACLVEGVRQIAHKHRSIFLRVNPDFSDDEAEGRKALLDAGFLHLADKDWSSLSDARVVMGLHLKLPESELLRRMRESHRQNIRGFAKKGLHLRDAREVGDVKRFHQLWLETGERRGFPVRSLDYYCGLWNYFVGRGHGRLLLAEKDGDLVAGLLMIAVGQKAWILHSGLTTKARKLKPNEAMWWEAMRSAKEQGATFCDFGGSGTGWPPQEDSPGYPIYLFKRGFRAETFYLTGEYDLVFKPRLYRLFRLGEDQLLPRVVTAFSLLRGLTRRGKNQTSGKGRLS